MRTLRQASAFATLLIAVGSGWAADVRVPRCLELADSHDHTVGAVLDIGGASGAFKLFTQVDGLVYPMTVEGNHLYGWTTRGINNFVLFKTPDCSGTPYIATEPIDFPVLQTSIAGNVLYGQLPG